jgi:hypothetical protein
MGLEGDFGMRPEVRSDSLQVVAWLIKLVNVCWGGFLGSMHACDSPEGEKSQDKPN